MASRPSVGRGETSAGIDRLFSLPVNASRLRTDTRPASPRRRRRSRNGLRAGLLLVGLGLGFATARARAQGLPIVGVARASLSTSSTSASVGSSLQVTLSVDLTGVVGSTPGGGTTPAVLGGYQIRISFPKTLLRFESASGGTSTGYTGTPITTDPLIANTIGSLASIAGQTSSSAPTGLSTVAVFSFTALAHGVASLSVEPLSLSSALIPGPPVVGLVSIPGSAGVRNVPINDLGGDLEPGLLILDPAAGGLSNGNGVFEPGEQAAAIPSWRNGGPESILLIGVGSAISGPAGASYSIGDAGAGYGSVASGASSDCQAATGNCYSLAVSNAAERPATHWDAYFTESLNAGDAKVWPLHVGSSFTDVPSGHYSYKSVETILHAGIGAGCGPTTFCPSGTVTRAQIAVFLLRGKHGTTYLPPAASGTVFSDVPLGSFAAAWIEELAVAGITGGCGGGLFCPASPVTRASMAVLLLRAEHGLAYTPPAATGLFSDVPVAGPFARWIEQLSREGTTAGCGGGLYCPDALVTRGQMAVFLAKTFQLGF